jgi:heme-degrading monooxygenase HmoA
MEVVLFKIRPRPDIDQDEYSRTFEEMLELAAQSPGFIGIDGYAGEDGSELAVARFESTEAIDLWRDNPRHVQARERGRREFFDAYEITIGTVGRHYDWSRDEDPV